MKFRLIPAIVVAITLTIVTSKIVYFGFNSSYNTLIFSRQQFEFVFKHDVFKYRVLSKYLLITLDNWLGSDFHQKETDLWIAKHNRGGTEHLYYSFFYLNTFFMVLSSIVFSFLLNARRAFRMTDPEKYLLLFLTIITINLSQFAVCPYDTVSYFLQLLILYLFVSYAAYDYTATLISICALIFLSTLNRESSSLSVAIMAVLFIEKWGINKKTVTGICLMAGIFILTYAGLRYSIADPENITFKNDLIGNFGKGLNLMGLLFWALFLFLCLVISNSRANRQLILLFHIFSLPYIIVCFMNGILWEVRLYMPLFLGALFLSKLDTDGLKLKTLFWLKPGS